MIKSMTGFYSYGANMQPFGKINIELKSTNHKFLEIVLQLPESLKFLEDKIKKEIEAYIGRGRVICSINISGGCANQEVLINRNLLRGYLSAAKSIKEQFKIKDEIGINTLMQLPGVFCLGENDFSKTRVWSKLKKLLRLGLKGFVAGRQKEGAALYGFLSKQVAVLRNDINFVQHKYDRAVKERMAALKNEEERVSFLKGNDITEEIDRLSFHAQNFIGTIAKNGPVGKELDFITQEMQREANTIGAKSCDKLISARVVQIKSQVEKMREQLQNIE